MKSRMSEPMSIKLCHHSVFPVMLLVSAVGRQQLCQTAQSDTAASPSQEFFGESMNFCKIIIHISNVINTIFSLPLTVVCVRRVGGRHLWDKQEQRKQSFLNLANENHKHDLAYIEIIQHFSWFPNSWLAFCLFLSLRLSLITQHAVLRHLPERLPHTTVSRNEKKVFIMFEILTFILQKRMNQIKSNQITFIVTSPQHKCLGEWNSYERAPDSAKNNNNNLHMDRQCKKKTTTTIYIWTDSAKKLHWSIYSAPDSAKKQQQFTYGQYIFTDCTEDNVQNTHTYTQYT